MLGPLVLLLPLLAPPQGGDPAPQQRLGGVWAFQIRSTLDLGPEHARQQLEVTFAFPDRARVQVKPTQGPEGQRSLTYRYGQGLWSVSPSKTASSPLTPAQRIPKLRELALRRALFLWPHGFTWTGQGPTRLAQLGDLGGDRRFVLRAVLPAGKQLPSRIEVLGPGGAILERLRDVTWARENGASRPRPAEFTFERNGRPVWHETVERATSGRFSDSFFEPLDLREIPQGKPRPRVRTLELSGWMYRRVGLEGRLSMPEALAEGDRILGAARALEAAPTIDPSLHLELDPQARPIAVWIVSRSGGPAPQGWKSQGTGTAFGVFLADPGACDPTLAALLERAALQAKRAPGSLLLRVRPPGNGPRRAELVLLTGQ
jgi:hypothetical protein